MADSLFDKSPLWTGTVRRATGCSCAASFALAMRQSDWLVGVTECQTHFQWRPHRQSVCTQRADSTALQPRLSAGGRCWGQDYKWYEWKPFTQCLKPKKISLILFNFHWQQQMSNSVNSQLQLFLKVRHLGGQILMCSVRRGSFKSDTVQNSGRPVASCQSHYKASCPDGLWLKSNGRAEVSRT